MRELVALRCAVAALRQLLRGKQVQFCLDSLPACRNLVNGGGRVPALSQEVKLIVGSLQQDGICAQFSWVPREQNSEADMLSRLFLGSWKLTTETKQWIANQFGPVWDSLAFSDKAITRLLCPKFEMVSESLLVAQRRALDVVLVFPAWPAQSWFPWVTAAALKLVELPSQAQLFEAGHGVIGIGARQARFWAALLKFAS
jgi:hypothetical protein